MISSTSNFSFKLTVFCIDMQLHLTFFAWVIGPHSMTPPKLGQVQGLVLVKIDSKTSHKSAFSENIYQLR